MLVPQVKFTVVMLLWLACFFVLISLSGKFCCLLKVNLLKEENRDLRINMSFNQVGGPYWETGSLTTRFF